MDHPEILDAYSRAEAIAHGLLVDVTAAAAGAGFTVPVALTWAAWSAAVEWPPAGLQREAHAGVPARLQQLVEQFMAAVKRSQSCHRTLEGAATPEGLAFDIEPGGRHGDGPPIVLTLEAVFALEAGQAAITIMLPDEF